MPAGRQSEDPALLEVEVDDLAEHALDVLVAAEDAAQRHRDLAFGQHAGGALVEQRLEQVVRRAVDDGDLDRAVPEGTRREESGEAAADDQLPGGG